jgi:uncharacterized phage protein (TIGR02220 family)
MLDKFYTNEVKQMQKGYYAIIPASVRYDDELTPNAKLLYGEITALCNEKGYCWAGNSYFADLYQKDKSTIKRWIKQLEDKGYITRKVKYKEGSSEIETRWMQLCDEGGGKNKPTPRGKNEPDNNTSFNTTFNNTKEYIVEIVNYLNDEAQTSFRSTTKKTQQLISARFKEGFTVDDFKTVIDKKVKEWKHDNKMKNFLRPETLFGTKFEGYLNQKGSGKSGFDWDSFDAEDKAKQYDFGF